VDHRWAPQQQKTKEGAEGRTTGRSIESSALKASSRSREGEATDDFSFGDHSAGADIGMPDCDVVIHVCIGLFVGIIEAKRKKD